jgi:outer membrane protein
MFQGFLMHKRMVAVLILLMGLTGMADGALGQTLEQALVAAFNNNPTLLAERAKLRAIDEDVAQALSNWRPTVEMVGDYAGRAVESNIATNRRQHRNLRSLSFTIEQSLYRGGRTVAATSQAENKVRAGRARLIAVEQRVLRDAATAYMNVVRDQAVLELTTNNEQVLKRHLEATRDRFQVGEITRTDVHQAEARLARASADRIQAESDLKAFRAAYRNVVGENPGSLAPVTLPTDLPVDGEEAIRIASVQAPEVVAGSFDEQALADDAIEVRGELLPEIDLEGTASRTFDSASQESRIDSFQAKVTLTVPLYQSGSVYSRLREARQSVAEQRLKTRQARRDAIEEATRSWEALQAARARIVAFRSEIQAAEVALEGVQREAVVGSRTVLDVLDAEQELLDAKVDIARAQRDEMVAIFELNVALGKMTAKHLKLPVEIYDPEDHYREVREKAFGGESSGQPEAEKGGSTEEK